MAFDLSVIGVWRFDGSLFDDVVSRDFAVSTAGKTEFTQFSKFDLLENKIESRKGLTFKSGISYTVTGDFNLGETTIAFWWNSPKVIGYTRHAVNRSLQTKIAPIFCKADSAGGDPLTFTNGSFFISEVAHSQTENAIRFSVCGSSGTTISHEIRSEGYLPGLRHVLVTFLKPEKLIRIDIDGKAGVFHSGPDDIFDSSGLLRINGFYPDYGAHTTEQIDGYLFDLVIKDIGSDGTDAVKMMRYGYEYITDEDLLKSKFFHYGLGYVQPTTITTTHIVSEGGSLLVARSDGELLRGVRPIWSREFNYVTPRGLTELTISKTDPEEFEEPEDKSKRIVEWTTSGLKLKGTIVRA